MVLLGIVIHASLLYQVNIFNLPVFFNDPKNHSSAMNVIADFVHTFRMPVFYVISGFFTALIYLERGPTKLIENRLHRLVYPFIAGLTVLLPAFLFSMNFFAAGLHGAKNMFGMALSSTIKTFRWTDVYTIHLWFLYYLIWFCIAGLAIGYAVNRWLPEIKNGFIKYFRFVFLLKAAPLIFAIPTICGLLAMKSFDIKAADSFYINPVFFVTFGTYFLVGWLCYCLREDLDRFSKLYILYLILACVLFALRWKLLFSYHDAATDAIEKASLHTILIVMLGFCIWFFTFGIMGLFMKFLNRPSAIARYISDGSYWIYLIHMPIVVIIQTLLLPYDISALVKFLFVNLITISITILSYNYLVRNTFIGYFLNGKKQPRRF